MFKKGKSFRIFKLPRIYVYNNTSDKHLNWYDHCDVMKKLYRIERFGYFIVSYKERYLQM